MQSEKTSSRKPKPAAESAPATPEAATTAPTGKTRKAPVSVTKKAAPKETTSVKRHRKAAAAPASEPAVSSTASPVIPSAEQSEAPVAMKAMAAASGTGYASPATDVIESVGNITEPTETATSTRVAERAGTATELERDEIERLAYFYWVARGQEHGSHEEDWLRAERELRLRR
jgi:hypothetical protein